MNTPSINYAQIEAVFKYFHVSDTKLGKRDTFIFNPRVPRTPYVHNNYRIEDDFTERVSLAPRIVDAMQAGADGRYVYAGDFKIFNDDDIKAIDLMKYWRKCPFAVGGVEDFNMRTWLEDIYKERFNDDSIRVIMRNGDAAVHGNAGAVDTANANRYIQVYSDKKDKTLLRLPVKTGLMGYFGPRDLPDDLQKLWYACVPDADETHEKWSTDDVKMVFVGMRDSGTIHLSETATEILMKLGYLNKSGKFTNLAVPTVGSTEKLYESWRDWSKRGW